MANTTDCERYLVEKLISILSKTLRCQSGNDDDQVGSEGVSESEASVAQKLLRVLISQSDDYFGRNGSLLEIELSSQDMNSSNATFLSGDGADLSFTDGGDPTSPHTNIISPHSNNRDPIMTNKLHKLELIKVCVLIFVISIILLTTCRMVFQLFIRFRPEKPPLG